MYTSYSWKRMNAGPLARNGAYSLLPWMLTPAPQRGRKAAASVLPRNVVKPFVRSYRSDNRALNLRESGRSLFSTALGQCTNLGEDRHLRIGGELIVIVGLVIRGLSR